MTTPLSLKVESINLKDAERLDLVLGCTPSILRKWEAQGCPLFYPDGHGNGKRCYAIVDEVLSWLRSRPRAAASREGVAAGTSSTPAPDPAQFAEKLRDAQERRRARLKERDRVRSL